MPQQKSSGLKKSACHLKYIYIPLLFLSGNVMTETISPLPSLNNCDTVGVDYLDNPELTRTEKLALMEQAFYASLLKFEDCNITASSSSTSTSSSANGASPSLSSQALQGSEAVTEPEVVEGLISPSENATNQVETGASEVGITSSSTNGRVPEDIPSADNDDVLSAQIRTAAEAETDPETRKKLWNEYRKYKGMNSEQ
jgi:hypothetical protein